MERRNALFLYRGILYSGVFQSKQPNEHAGDCMLGVYFIQEQKTMGTMVSQWIMG